MTYEWDPHKLEANLQKHRVDFADAIGVLEDPRAITIRDPDGGAEERFITLGVDYVGRVLVVVYAWRGNRIRVISARRATRRERGQYGEPHAR